MPITTLVVGATGDLGSTVSRALFAAGHTVIIHGLSRSNDLDALGAEVNAPKRLVADVADPTGVAAMFAELPHLDNMVFCVGTNPTAATVMDTDVEVWRRIIDVNLTGAFLCVQAAMASMRASSAPSVVLVSSIFGLTTPARRAAYGASKHGLTGLVQAVTREEGSWLRINAVCPGPMWSENLRSILTRHSEAAKVALEDYVLRRVADIPAGRLMDLDECASVIAFLCAPASTFLRGECVRVSGGAIQ